MLHVTIQTDSALDWLHVSHRTHAWNISQPVILGWSA
jgi:hypothetical protein